jgi:N-acetyl-1-D-myo-inositol-2-amino-2-deoxy-alpha-D-glucopyranoside deacetylase
MPQTPRLLLVHAHPDDETINNGATMAHYAKLGYGVTLITSTAGEEGEVLVDHLAHVASHAEDTLGHVREKELAKAMRLLGVSDHRFLGGHGHFRDSGMMGTEPNNRPDCYWQADLLDAATLLVEVIREVKPHVLVTYDDFGGYGHPDHIKAHRVAMYAYQLASVATFKPELGAAWQIQKVYWNASPKGPMRQAIAQLKAQGVSNEFTEMDIDAMPFFVEDEVVTTRISAPAFAKVKTEALAAHLTQVDLTQGHFAAMIEYSGDAFGIEHYRLVAGPRGELDPETGWETDLFSGVTL